MGKILLPTGETREIPCKAELVSDGYHSFKDLYDHRITLFIALAKRIEQRETDEDIRNGSVWRSKSHSDGNPAYEGWYIMGIGKAKGEQITYHLPLSRWDETDFAETLEKAPEFDGHSSKDVLERLKQL